MLIQSEFDAYYRAKGFRKFHMDGSLIVKCANPAVGFVDDLIGYDQIARLEFLPQTSHRAAGNDVSAAQLLEGENVCAERHL